MATTPNYVLLQKITVGATTAASVTFSNLNTLTGYTDLKIVLSARGNLGQVYSNLYLQLNGDSTTGHYGSKALYSTGAATGVGANISGTTLMYCGTVTGANATANAFGNAEIYIPNFNVSSANKAISVDSTMENNATSSYLTMANGVFTPSTSGTVTSATIFLDGGYYFQQYSTFSLYGLAAVGTTPVVAPYAIGGDIIKTDGTYWYHAFLSSGSFTPNKSLSCDVLVVAGGGAGGAVGGGGGAGGVLGFASQALAANTALTATVGAGGTGTAASGTNGNNSSFGSITPVAVGGGGGGGYGFNGSAGGSGGGAGWNGTTLQTGGTGSQGNNGGNSNNSNNTSASRGEGGGGGAGGNGGSATTPGTGGIGGNGVNSNATFTNLSTALSTLGLGVSGYIAGGGGGEGFSVAGTAGSGGGGTGGASGNGTSAVANTGSGGGGGTSAGGTGGSGLIILRYAI